MHTKASERYKPIFWHQLKLSLIPHAYVICTTIKNFQFFSVFKLSFGTCERAQLSTGHLDITFNCISFFTNSNLTLDVFTKPRILDDYSPQHMLPKIIKLLYTNIDGPHFNLVLFYIVHVCVLFLLSNSYSSSNLHAALRMSRCKICYGT